jgi:hypothetical protein
MKSIYKPGTDGYAQAKAVRTFCIALTAVVVIIFALFVVPSNNFLHRDFVRASTIMNVVAILSVAGQIFVTWRILSKVMNEEVYSGTWVYYVTMVWLILNICFLAGFNFSL